MLADRHGHAVATSISAVVPRLLVLGERVEERRQVGEDVADERVDDEGVQVRVDLQELAKAEREVVERAHELAEAHDGAPLPGVVLVEVRGRHLAGGEPGVDGVGAHLAALQRQEHAGGEQRIEERKSIAHQAEAVAADALRVIGVLARDADWPGLPADADVIANPGARLRFSMEDRVGIASVPIEIPRLARPRRR